MSSPQLWIIVCLIVLSIFLVVRDRRHRKHMQEALNILDDMVDGNVNRRIHIGAHEPLAPLVFKINDLVESYQNDKVELLRAEQERKRILSSLSHDVRTPLTSVLGYLDALCEGMADEESDEYLRIARAKAYALKEYVDELFTVVQIDADELGMVVDEIDLYELLRSEIIGWIPRLQNDEISLEIKIPDKECCVAGDQRALTRIFSNLLQNAVRYGGSQGVIGIEAWDDDFNVYFEIWDKGPGIPAEEIPRVFERLYKTDSSRKSAGHGLGLSIAKDLLKRMRGKIHIESTPYVKTTAQVSLPKCKRK